MTNEILNPTTLRKMADRLGANAVTVGLVRERDGNYLLAFNPETSCYDVTDPNGEHFASFRTYKITQAKKWLREELA